MGITKSIIIFFFCAKLVLPHETVEQFFRVPALIEHFAAHQTKDSSMGLIDFISFHYSDEANQSAGHAAHEKIPFSHHEHSTQCAQNILLYQPSARVTLQFKNVSTGDISFINYVDAYYPAHAASIWQPPKIG